MSNTLRYPRPRTLLGDSKSSTRAIIPHAVYSDVIEVIRQQQYVFEVLWNKAAEKRIKEIEVRVQPVGTRILEDEDQIISELRHLKSSSNKLSICCEYGSMQMGSV